MKYFLILMLMTSVAFAKEINQDVKYIINSTERNSEKPLISQDACCPQSNCPDGKKGQDGTDCSKILPILHYEKGVNKKDETAVLLEGKIYEVDRPKGEKRVVIIGKKSKKLYFYLDDNSQDFRSNGKILIPSDKDFVQDYRRLKNVFKDIKFRELCQYLARNAQKYARLKLILVKNKAEND